MTHLLPVEAFLLLITPNSNNIQLIIFALDSTFEPERGMSGSKY